MLGPMLNKHSELCNLVALYHVISKGFFAFKINIQDSILLLNIRIYIEQRLRIIYILMQDQCCIEEVGCEI